MKRWILSLMLFSTADRLYGGNILLDNPSGSQFVEGDSVSAVPFGSGWPIRYQQVYNAQGFSPLLPFGGGFITRLGFRPDSVFGDTFGATFGNIEFRLSTTSRSADNLSMVFEENVGPDVMSIFGPSELLWGATTSPGGSPQSFDLRLALPAPFFYNPSAGNLLLDVTILEGAITTYFDAEDGVGDGLSRIWSQGEVGETASFADSIGLVTRFNFTVIPEPQSLWLLALGLAAAALGMRKLQRGSH